MLSKAQNDLYWRLWAAACKANAWRVQDGRAQNAHPEIFRSEEHRKVLSFAAARAAKQFKAISLDDIRHAVHIVACNCDISHSKLSQDQFTRVVLLLRLLADPDDLEATNEWLHPDLAKRRSLMRSISRVPRGYVNQIASDVYKTTDLDRLSLAELRGLSNILFQRQGRQLQTNKPF